VEFVKFAIRYPSVQLPSGYFYSQIFDHERLCELSLTPGKGQTIHQLKLTVLEKEEPGCYYGWLDSDGKLPMVWYHQKLLALCFGDQKMLDRKAAEGQGRMVWLKVEEIGPKV
jgi:hypothetical protein